MLVYFTVADCGRGYFLNTSDECEACDVGYYQDVDWRDRIASIMEGEMPYITTCQKCATGTSTEDTGSDSEDDCRSRLPKKLFLIFMLFLKSGIFL